MSRFELLQKLKGKRKEFADREAVELFMVFTNKTLEETVKAMPTTLADLALVKGWGKTKIAKYGSEILNVFSGVAEVGLPQYYDTPVVIYSVAEFVDAVNITLAQLGTVRVQGEVSELQHRGKAVYFVLKDAEGEANIKCILWAWKFNQEYDYIEDGMEIIVDALPEVYAKFGTFNLRIERVEPVGEGALRKAFEALKKKLSEKGYFDEARKRSLPLIIQRIGIITSEKGEAINDFLKNVGSYGLEIVLVDVRVEGDQAEASIVSAFQRLNTVRQDLDIICLIRGGGGLENLQAFNTERVATAVISSRIPVLTGIGHERDSTIAGLSSDADFSTPTKVADAIRRSREDLLRTIDRERDMIISRVSDLLQETTHMYVLQQQAFIRMPSRLLEQIQSRISVNAHRLETALGRIFAAFRDLERGFTLLVFVLLQRTQVLSRGLTISSERMKEIVQKILYTHAQRLAVSEVALLPLNPEAPLRRGYSIVYGKKGKVIKNAGDVILGEQVSVTLYKGKIHAQVTRNRIMDYEYIHI